MVHQLLRHLDHYLVGHSSLRQFEAWLLANLQGILDSGDATAVQLANQVDADLVELGEGLIDEAALRERLESRVRRVETISISSPETAPLQIVAATASAETLRVQVEIPLPGHVVNLRLVHVFA